LRGTSTTKTFDSQRPRD